MRGWWRVGDGSRFDAANSPLNRLWNQTDDRQRVLDATDIVRLVGEHVALKAKGKEYVGLCPFHNDHSPSMYVVPNKQIFHCFVCGAGGGALDFVMRAHGMSFIEALKHLADKAGIQLTPRRREAPAAAGPEGLDAQAEGVEGITKDDLAAANAFALEFFRTILRHSEHGTAARAVIEQRRIDPEMAERFQIGAAPDRWDGLLKTLEARGMDVRPFVVAGLLKSREASGPGGGGYYDALRNRVIFPILDQLNRPIAFGGRKINPQDEPKYLNSPETPLFNKSATLFALPQALAGIRNERCAIITEGYTDAIACHQAGFTNAVATLGTALTVRHAAALRRICDRVVLLFDADDAGQKAADRAMEVFFGEPLDVLVMSLPGGKDPDEVLKTEGGADVFRAQLKAAVDMFDFRFARKAAEMRARGALPGTAVHARMIEEDLARLVELGLDRVSPLRRQTVLTRYAQLAGVSPEVINKTIGTLGRTRPVARPEPVAVSPFRAAGTPAQSALACLLVHPLLASAAPGRARELAEQAARESGDGSPLGVIARWVLDRIDLGEEPSLDGFLGQSESSEARSLATALACEAERTCDKDDGGVVAAFHEAARRADAQRTRADMEALLGGETGLELKQPTGPTDTPADDDPAAKVRTLQRLLELRRSTEPQTGPLLTVPRPGAPARSGA